MSQEHQQYIQEKINPVLENMVTQILLDRPDDVLPFMINWIKTNYNISTEADDEVAGLRSEISLYKEKIHELKSSCGKADAGDDEEEEEEDDDDWIDELPVRKDPEAASRPRQSVSAEAYGDWNKKQAFTPPSHPKSAEEKKAIQDVLCKSFMFSMLDSSDAQVVINAMVKKELKAGERIIEQGDDGDVMYVIEQGHLECFKKFAPNEEEKLVKTCDPGDIFGELALLYNCPRAASVAARDICVLWQLDRETFNHIVKEAASKKRNMYEQFLTKVPLLESLDSYERSQVADALQSLEFVEGDYLCRQGDAGDKFFILVDGDCVATKSYVANQPAREVESYKSGDYFGELALLKNEPRAANVIAKGAVKVASLDRRAFKRLLGPLEDILKRASEKYE